MLVLPVSSSVCQRGFSAQKRIKYDVRGSLHVDTVEDLIQIIMEGPSLQEFDVKEALKNGSVRVKGLGSQITRAGLLSLLVEHRRIFSKEEGIKASKVVLAN